MRKYILYICILLLVISLISCNKTGDTDITPDGDVTLPDTSGVTGEENPLSFVPTSDVWEVYCISKNVYSGIILSAEYSEVEGKEVLITLTVKVEEVYKGDYTVGDTVKEAFSETNFGRKLYEYYGKIQTSYLDNYFRYFFMVGIDDDTADIKRAESIRSDSSCSLIRFVGPTLDLDYHFLPTYLRYVSYNDLIHRYMFDTYTQLLESIGKDTYSEKSLMDYCKLADNIYYGEILESTPLGKNSTRDTVYKNKVRVLNVYKGDYKPGQIVEDISLKNYGYAPILPGFQEFGFPKRPDGETWGLQERYRSNYAFFMTGEYYNDLYTVTKNITN